MGGCELSATLLVFAATFVFGSGWFRRRRELPPVTTPPAGSEDVSEDAEAALTLRYVSQSPQALKKAAEAQANKPVEAVAEPEEEIEPLAWDEQDDVFRPQIIAADALLASLPLPALPSFQQDEAGIFIHRAAYETLRQHLKSDVTVEQGGLLLGQAFHDPDRNAYFLLVEQALPAVGGLETEVSFSYTETAWEHLTPHLQQMGAIRTLLGSYHSHPGMGVFLSKTDLETQAEIFPHPWQIALVVDPVADKTGFFLGKTGHPCERWYLLDV